ncbi:MAG: hypothetical protein ACKO2G_16465 [Verrucomicrobiales bacterium]
MTLSTRRLTMAHLVIIVVVMAWFSPWWAAGRFLAPLDLQNQMMSPWASGSNAGYTKNHFVSDGVDQYLVYRLIAERDLQREGRVGWSSLTYGGTAQYANTMALYDDWTMQLHRWFDFKTAWHIGILGQVFVAAFGMYFFLRGRDCSPTWAVVGALLWAANSQFVTWVYHRWALGSFCWVPWVFWSLDRSNQGKRSSNLTVPIFLALAFLGGTLQHSALVAIVVLTVWLEQATKFRARIVAWLATLPGVSRISWLSPSARSLPEDNKAEFAGRGDSLPRYLFLGVLGVGLAGFMFVPCIGAFIESNRLGLHIGTYGHAPGWYPAGTLQPVLNALSYPFQIFPSLLGRCDSLDVLKLFKSELFYVAFFGTIPMVVAIASCRLPSTPLLAKLLMAIGLLLPLTPLVRLLYQRLLLLFILGGILGFAHFMSHADGTEIKRLFRRIAKCAAVICPLWLAVSALLQLPQINAGLRSKIQSAYGGGGSFGYYQTWVGLRVDRFIDGLAIWSMNHALPLAFFGLALAGLWMMASSSTIRRRIGSIAVGLAALGDVSIFASRWIVWSDLPLFAETPESAALREHVGKGGRTTTMIHPEAHLALTPFVPNLLAVYEVASVHGYDSIIPDGMMKPFETQDNATRLGRVGVTHLITWHGNQGVPRPWEKIWSGGSMDLYRNPKAVPRYAGFTDTDAQLAFQNGGAFRGVEVEESLLLENKRLLHVPQGICSIRIAENAAAGWKYRIGSGGWMEPTRAADKSMVLELGPSSEARTVDMVYDPPLRRAGWLVSAISCGILVLSLVVFRSQKITARAKLKPIRE